MNSLVLASTSPRRRQLLALFDCDFTVMAADIDESRFMGESAAAMTLRLAECKARAVYQRAGGGRVLAGDTVVALGEAVFGKPADCAAAMQMLRTLSARTHSVFSAVALMEASGCRSLLSETRVTFAALSEATIATYCAGDDPYDKAGGYGIQGKAGTFVTQLDGSYSGVSGLPLWAVHRLLMQHDLG